MNLGIGLVQDIFQAIKDAPVMILLIGPPASGKSTWRASYMARRDQVNELLVAANDLFPSDAPSAQVRLTTVVSSDDIYEEYAAANGVTYNQAYANMSIKDVEREMKRRFAEALDRRDDIIVDRTNMSVSSRNKSLARAHQLKVYKTIGIVFEVDEEVLTQRRADRFEATGKSVPENSIADMVARYEEPTRDEFDLCFKTK